MNNRIEYSKNYGKSNFNREKFRKIARKMGMEVVPPIYDKEGKRVYMVLPNGAYSYEDPRFDLSYYDEPTTNTKPKKNHQDK
ncbi:hypothetical protein [Companilactobacillus hulinensis]|uniref:hypothetical protein n=1 Tax=Companilactobacillus hulinensis TaxID=2486007 RepID=UPI000F7B272F|nr:hypothetical protein [Companilactobacillus hulinensis]